MNKPPRHRPVTSSKVVVLDDGRANILQTIDDEEYVAATLRDEAEARRTLRAWSSDAGWIYFIRDGDIVKIGRTTKSPLSRLQSHQVGNPRALSIDHAIEVKLAVINRVEKAFHKHWAHRRVRGEWFTLSKEETADFLEVRAKILIKYLPEVPIKTESMRALVEHLEIKPDPVQDDPDFARKYVEALARNARDAPERAQEETVELPEERAEDIEGLLRLIGIE